MTAHRDLHLELLHRLWRFGRAELGALAAMIIAGTGLWAFAELADDMMEDEGHGLDALVLEDHVLHKADQPARPGAAAEIGRILD